jgi:hypothetical protein
MWELVQVTAQYSNAVLLAVLPYVSDFSKKLDLPVPTPIQTNQVLQFKCDPRLGQTGGAVILTNGSIFTFLEGRVCLYRSPQSYYSLQEPEDIPHFYGTVKVKEKTALQTARDAIKKLGYKASVFNLDSEPLVTRPLKIGKHFVPRYRFIWTNPNLPIPKDPNEPIPALLDMEVNASNGKIEMLAMMTPESRRLSPKVDVTPPLLHSKETKPKLGGIPTERMKDEDARALLSRVLAQLPNFITTLGLTNIPLPITTNQIQTNVVCRIYQGKPVVQLYLTNGDRFFCNDGVFTDFYAHDAYRKFPVDGRPEDFLGHINITTDDAIAFCESKMRKLGFTGKFPHPIVTYSLRYPTSTRYVYYWRNPGQDSEFASMEVDMETKTIKSVFLERETFRRGK